MISIDEMIFELCPHGVEFKQLGEVGKVIRGKRFVKQDMMTAPGVPCIHYGEIYTKYGISANESLSNVSAERAKTLRFAQPGDVILASAGERVEDIGKAVAWLGNQPIAIHDACYSFSSPLDPKYVSYFFASRAFRGQIRQHISSSKISSISTQNISRARIPVPPLEVQREIVRILDQFTALEAELEAEVEARRKQYEHYRSGLLTFDDDVQIFALGKIVDVKTGSAVSKKAIQEDPGPYPVINSGRDPLGFIGKFNTDGAPIGVTSRGAGVGSITWCDGRYFRGNLNYGVTIRDEDQVNVRFLYHTLQYLQPQIKELCSFQGIPALNKVNLEKLIVPLPSRIAQARTAEMLDKFDALVNDLSVGLPAELAARRKQYEYYRDKLLTFEEAPA